MTKLLSRVKTATEKNDSEAIDNIKSELDELMGQLKKEVSSSQEKIDSLEAGKSFGLTVNDIATKHKVQLKDLMKELKKGISIEREHTDDRELAKKIAMDHLFEFPDYYSALIKMEKHLEEK